MKKVKFYPCIPGHEAMYDGTRVATIRKDGSVHWETNLMTVSSAHPYGKSYSELLPAKIVESIEKFSKEVA